MDDWRICSRPLPKMSGKPASSCFSQPPIWVGWTPNICAIWAAVLCALIADSCGFWALTLLHLQCRPSSKKRPFFRPTFGAYYTAPRRIAVPRLQVDPKTDDKRLNVYRMPFSRTRTVLKTFTPELIGAATYSFELGEMENDEKTVYVISVIGTVPFGCA
jgi:hypothetical protein